MANAAKLISASPARVLVTGYPGSAKTGSLASLANAGFKLRVLDFDGNPESLLLFTNPECLKNIDIVSLEDPITEQGRHLGTKMPTAFLQGLRLMDRWKYEDPDGVLDEKTGRLWVDLGSSKEWGLDTIVVLDGITGNSAAAMARARSLTNQTPENTTQQTWGMAAQDQLSFIKRLTASTNRHHVVALSHLKMVGPKDTTKGESEVSREIKERMVDMIPTRLLPTAVGWSLPQQIAGEFPVAVNMEVRFKGNTAIRSMQVLPRKDMDLKVPARDLEKLEGLGPETGLIELFKALGHKPPLEQ